MNVPYDTRLPPELRALKVEIEAHARAYGLDFYETIFEVVDADDLNEIAAYGGFPTRYPHWSFGMAYEELRKGYDYGLSKIYEMVINNDPCYAYLMRCNHTVDQKLVMAHVYGHCDFFKNNAYFAHTSRKMMDEMANHGVRIRRYAEKYGEDAVEAFIDRCMSIDDLIDVHSTAIKRREGSSRYDFREPDDEALKLTRFKSKDYMSDYINPPDALRAEEEERKKRQQASERSFPERPEKDVLLFLIEHAPLRPWQRDVLSIIRDEAYYFAPQAQTKIINEGWACVTANSLVNTGRGLLRMADLVRDRSRVTVDDGQGGQPVYDWAEFKDRETVRLRTRRGFEVEGSRTHRLLVPGGPWKRLDELRAGDRVCLSPPPATWPTAEVVVERAPLRRTRRATELAAAFMDCERDRQACGAAIDRRTTVRVPATINEDVAAVLGYLTGNGHISAVKRTIGLTTGDDEQAERFASLVESAFGVQPRKRRDDGRWRVGFSSARVKDFLVRLGMKTGACARQKVVPDCILRSPRRVVAAFLRAYFDGDGDAGNAGVVLATASEEMSKVVHLLLLNFGVLSTRRPMKDGRWRVRATGGAAAVFAREIGFGLRRKQDKLREYLARHQRFRERAWEDEVVAVEPGRADVYDVSVAQTHRYAAQGFINHNSYWHSTIMTERALQPWECVDYADHHSGTMAVSRGRVNPYKLGIELLRDIEMRWDTGRFGKDFDECDDLDRRRSWDRKLGLGKQKIFEVRRVHNDITFIDTFLTPEFCARQQMFSYAYAEQGGNYVIESREFQKIKERLLFGLTNFGKPFIYVVDGNYRNRGELLLRHEYNGIDLRLDRAADTLANVQAVWGRPVHLQTVVDKQPSLMSYDGNAHSLKNLGDSDDPRKHAAEKTR